MLALALAFVGPVGPILEAEPVAVQLVGDPANGKTTIGIAAGSVWGLHVNPERASAVGFGETWNQTTNHIETVAAAHNHTFLFLDETRVAPSVQAILETVMRLASSTGKGRMNAGASASWWVPMLSTSNRSLDALAWPRHPIDDAHRGRLIDVPSPIDGNGVFEQLHGSLSVADFSQRILILARANYGLAGRRFVTRLAAWRRKDEAGLKAWLCKRHAWFVRTASKVAVPGRNLSRIREKLATVYAAGRLAIRFKILPWTHEELQRALLACLKAHVDLVAGSPAASPPALTPALLDRLRAHVRVSESQFIDLRRDLVRDPNHNHEDCAGYLALHSGTEVYLFSNSQFERISGSKVAAQRLKQVLQSMDAIRSAGGGRDGKRFAVEAPIFHPDSGKLKRASVIAVLASAISAQST